MVNAMVLGINQVYYWIKYCQGKEVILLDTLSCRD